MQPSPLRVARAYRIKWWLRIFAIVWTSFAAIGWGGMLLGHAAADQEGPIWLFAMGPLWAGGGTFWVAHLFRARVTLFEDAIETSGLLGTKRLRFDEIRGRRERVVTGDGEAGDTHYYKVISNDDRRPSLDFVRDYNFDNSFHVWFKSLRDLDAPRKQP